MNAQDSSILTLGIDLGGTKIDTALVDSTGHIIAGDYRLLSPDKDPEKTAAAVILSARSCLQQAGRQASALGIGVAGQIDKEEGMVRDSPNLPGWKDVHLGKWLAEALEIPVFMNNDVRLITLGEWQYGAGKGLDDLVCLIVGTGIGGGIISGGRLVEGSRNTAAELGHMTVVAAGRKCHCPNEGCLEAYAGGWAIAERTRDAVRANPQAGQALVSLAGDIDSITAVTLSRVYSQGDMLAHRMVKDTAKYLASGVVSIVNALNPSLVILGGSVILGIPDLVTAVEQRVMALALPTAREKLRISLGALGNKAGVIGAAAYAAACYRADIHKK